MASPEVLIVAAEASSELYATRLIEETQKRGLKVRFFGIGSRSMQNLGCEIVEKSENMAVVGLWEVLAHWSVIAGAFKKLVGLARDRHPKACLLLDYPDFNLRLAKKIKQTGVPVVYFISPQVWAWRQKRVFLIKKIVDKMLVVFPFEKGFYEKFQVPVSFVGHPLLDEMKNAKLSQTERTALRQKYGVSQSEFLVGLLPGSRRSELKYNLESQLRTAERLAGLRPHLRFILLVAPSLEIEEVKNRVPESLKANIQIVKEPPFQMLQIFDACLVASGTATLMTALAETPMVIMYKMNFLTGFLAKRLVKGPAFFGMANLILNERAVPEYFQEEANPQILGDALLKYIDEPMHLQNTKNKLKLTSERLGSGGAISRVVDELEKVLGQ